MAKRFGRDQDGGDKPITRLSDKRSDEAEAYRKLYAQAAWRKGRRAHQLAVQPVCERCLAGGLVNDGTMRADGSVEPNRRRHFLVADHVEPHKGDLYKFWHGALQTLCPDHHDRVKQSEERRGYSTEIGLDGWPVDPQHPARRD